MAIQIIRIEDEPGKFKVVIDPMTPKDNLALGNIKARGRIGQPILEHEAISLRQAIIAEKNRLDSSNHRPQARVRVNGHLRRRAR